MTPRDPDTVAGQAAALAAGSVTAQALTERALELAARNEALNAFVSIDRAGALAAARAAEAAIARGERSPLSGIPIAHKDVLMTAGLRTTCASRMLADFVAPYDAHVV